MTRRTTLFIVFAFEIALLLFVAAWSALADTENSNNWFIEGRYQASLYEGTGWSSSEYDTPGSESSQIQSATSESRDKLNSAGFAVGYFAGNNGIRDYDMGIFKTDVNAVEASIRLRYLF